MDENRTKANLEDDESDVDACDVTIDNPTSDEDLPQAEGGVA